MLTHYLKSESIRFIYRLGIKKGDTKKSNALFMFIETLFFVSWLARNSQFMSSFSSSTRKNFSSISRSHSVHKSVLISSFSFRWLKRSFAHCFVSLKSYLYLFLLRTTVIRNPSANIQRLFFLTSSFVKIFSIHFTIFAFLK